MNGIKEPLLCFDVCVMAGLNDGALTLIQELDSPPPHPPLLSGQTNKPDEMFFFFLIVKKLS